MTAIDYRFIELGEFFGFEQALKRGATPEIRLPTQDNPTTLHWVRIKKIQHIELNLICYV